MVESRVLLFRCSSCGEGVGDWRRAGWWRYGDGTSWLCPPSTLLWSGRLRRPCCCCCCCCCCSCCCCWIPRKCCCC